MPEGLTGITNDGVALRVREVRGRLAERERVKERERDTHSLARARLARVP